MDADTGKIVAVETTGAAVRTWTLDVCTNTWRMMRPPQEPALNGMVIVFVYDADAHLIVAVSEDQLVWTYSVKGNRWTVRPSGGTLPPILWQATYEPSSGNVIARDPRTGDLWSYSVGASEWTTWGKPGPTKGDTYGPGDLMAYDTALRRLVLVLMPVPSWPPPPKSAQFWTFEEASGSWTRRRGVPPQIQAGGEIAYDQSAQRIVAFGNGTMATYNATQDRWATVPLPRSLFNPLTETGPLARIEYTMLYDPINERIVILGGRVPISMPFWSTADDVWAYKLASNTWTELVPSRE